MTDVTDALKNLPPEIAKRVEPLSRPAIIIFVVLRARGGYAERQDLVVEWSGYSPSIVAKSLKELEQRKLIRQKSMGGIVRHGRRIEVQVIV